MRLSPTPSRTGRRTAAGADASARPGSVRRQALRTLWPSLSAQRRALVLASLAAIGSQVIGVPLALVVRRLVERYAEDSSSAPIIDTVRHVDDAVTGLAAGGVHAIAPLAAGFLGVILLRGWLRWIQTARTEAAAARIVADLRLRMHDRLHHVGLGYFDRRPVGRTIVRFTGDAGAVRGWIQSVLVRLPADVLTVIAVAAALVVVHPALLPAAAGPLVLLVPLMILLHPRIRRWTRDGRRAQSRLSGLLATRLPAMPAFRCFDRTASDDVETRVLIDDIARAHTRRGRVDAWVHGSTMAAGTASIAGVALVGLLHPDIVGGDLVAAIWLTLMVRGPVMRLGRASSTHQRAMISFERIAALAGRPAERGHRFVGPPPSIPGERLSFRGVGYRDHRDRWLLRETDLSVTGPGLHVLTADPAASTAALDLVVRLRRPHTGHLELDGHDLRSLPLDHLRRRVARVDRDRSVLEVAAATGADDWWAGAALDADTAWAQTDPHREGPNVRHVAGERARLRQSVWRALATDPSVLLIDDPLRDLPAADRAAVIRMLQRLAETRLVLVTGDDVDLLAAARPVSLTPTTSPTPAPCLHGRAG